MSWFALHGFLGSPDDWKSVLPAATAWDLFAPPWDWSRESLVEAGHHVIQKARPTSERWLVGYSMGARIAMHALLRAEPGFWAGAVLVSGNPGLRPEKRKTRRENDERWAVRFENCSPAAWPSLIEEWDRQSVFSGSRKRGEAPLHDKRALYAGALRSGSLGNQEDLREGLRSLATPTLWVTGERDRKFRDLAEGAAPTGFHRVIEGAGHRVPWDQPEKFRREIQAFQDRSI